MTALSHKELRFTYNMFRMKIRDRYLGSKLGSVWAIANPIVMLGIYTFVFGYVYKAKTPGSDTTMAFAIWLISGYGPWLAIMESLTGSANSIVGDAGLIKNLSFSTETLPIAATLVGIVPLTVSLVFMAGLLLVDGNPPTWHVIFIVPVLLVQIAFSIGLGFYLAATNVFARDLGILLPNLLLIILFATPIFYPLEAVPSIVAKASQFNPFFVIADSYREPLIYHRVPNLWGLAYVSALSVVLCVHGLKFFRRLKGNFEGML